MVRKLHPQKKRQTGQNSKTSVIWLPGARDDTKRLYDFIFEKNPQAAEQALNTIFEGAKYIASYPSIGRPLQDGTVRREWSASFGSGGYVLRYSLNEENIPCIIRIWHNLEKRTDQPDLRYFTAWSRSKR